MMKTWPYAAALLWSIAMPLPAQDARDTSRAPRADTAAVVVRATPTLRTFLDSAALHAALVRLPAPREGKRAARVFVVAFDSAGRPQPVRPAVRRAMPDAYRDSVTPLIQAALRPMAPFTDGWQAMLLVESGAAPAIREVVLPERQPRVANMQALSAALYASAQRLVNTDSSLEGTELLVHVALRVDEDGYAAPRGITRSSGNAAVDDAAFGAVLDAVRIIRFHPGLLDGEPVQTRVVLPIRFVFPKD